MALRPHPFRGLDSLGLRIVSSTGQPSCTKSIARRWSSVPARGAVPTPNVAFNLISFYYFQSSVRMYVMCFDAADCASGEPHNMAKSVTRFASQLYKSDGEMILLPQSDQTRPSYDELL